MHGLRHGEEKGGGDAGFYSESARECWRVQRVVAIDPTQNKRKGWPQLWLPRAQQLAVPGLTFEGRHWRACQASGASAGDAEAAPPFWSSYEQNTTMHHLVTASSSNPSRRARAYIPTCLTCERVRQAAARARAVTRMHQVHNSVA
jgi:hypothetical protein